MWIQFKLRLDGEKAELLRDCGKFKAMKFNESIGILSTVVQIYVNEGTFLQLSVRNDSGLLML